MPDQLFIICLLMLNPYLWDKSYFVAALITAIISRSCLRIVYYLLLYNTMQYLHNELPPIRPTICDHKAKNYIELGNVLKRIRKKIDSSGFTILEVMIGLVIFSIGLLTLLSMIVISIGGNSWSDRTTQTVQMVRETIEGLKNTPSDLLGYYGYEDEGGIFRHWYIEDSYDDNGDVKKVTVWVYWSDEFDRPQYTSTTTYFQPKQ